MGKIFDLAGQLNGSPSPSPASEPQESTPESDAEPSDVPPSVSAEQLQQMGALLSRLPSFQTMDDKTAALVAALRPFLKKDRQKKLDRAVQVVSLTHTAKTLYHAWKEGDLHV